MCSNFLCQLLFQKSMTIYDKFEFLVNYYRKVFSWYYLLSSYYVVSIIHNCFINIDKKISYNFYKLILLIFRF